MTAYELMLKLEHALSGYTDINDKIKSKLFHFF